MVGGVVCAAVSALAESANSENGPAPHLMLGYLTAVFEAAMAGMGSVGTPARALEEFGLALPL